MAIDLPLEVCLCVDDDILRLLGIALEKLMKRWLKAYYIYIYIYIYICIFHYCVLGKNLHA